MEEITVILQLCSETPFEITANYVKMDYKKAYITYDTETELSNETLDEYKEGYIEYIKGLLAE